MARFAFGVKCGRCLRASGSAAWPSELSSHASAIAPRPEPVSARKWRRESQGFIVQSPEEIDLATEHTEIHSYSATPNTPRPDCALVPVSRRPRAPHLLAPGPARAEKL